MKKLKLMTILGTRPEIIKLSEIIKKANIYFEHILVHTGQNYDENLNDIFFQDLGLTAPNHYLNVVGEDLGETIGNIISKTYNIVKKEKPDAILILGDTNSALSAISAKRLKCPIFHLEAGNRCFDENLPEEINRRIVDHISDVNLAYSEHARRYMYEEGLRKEHVFVVGSPMKEVINTHLEKITKSDVLARLNIKKNGYILVSAHREENIDNEKNFVQVMESINTIAETFKVPVIYSVHPRSDKMIKSREFKFNDRVKKMKPFNFSDFIHLQMNALCVVSDSGTLAEESSILGFPAVSLRTSTERPEALDKGSFIIGHILEKNIIQSVTMAIEMFNNREERTLVNDYSDQNVSIKTIKIIQSYTPIINSVVWKK